MSKTMPFLGERKNFEDVYPKVKDVRTETKILGCNLEQVVFWSPKNGPKINCICGKGEYDLEYIFFSMYDSSEKEKEGSLWCSLRSDKRRVKRADPCMNILKYKICIEYEE